MLLRFTILARNILQVIVKFNDFVRNIARFVWRRVRSQPKMNETIQHIRIRSDFTALQIHTQLYINYSVCHPILAHRHAAPKQ